MTRQEKQRQYNRDWKARNRDKVRADARKWSKTLKGKALHRRAHLRRRYGLTDDQYRALLGPCAVCGTPMERPYVDHNHQTGAVRGLVHQRCNIVVGWVEKYPELVAAAFRYLGESH